MPVDASNISTLGRTTPGGVSARKSATGERESRASRRCGPSCVRPTPAQAHCAAECHLTFGGVSGFDAHRRNGECVDPATLGMVERDGIWRKPMSAEAAARFDSLREDGAA